ncbi:PAS domain S-box protein [bacterium]|nr:PAS domain S-box protein [bacterium]
MSYLNTVSPSQQPAPKRTNGAALSHRALRAVAEKIGLWWSLLAVGGAILVVFAGQREWFLLQAFAVAIAILGISGLQAWANIALRSETQPTLAAHSEAAAAVEASPTPMYAFHVPSRTMLYVNDDFAKLLGYAREELEGQIGLGLCPEWVATRAELGLQRLATERFSHAREVPWIRRDGAIVWLDMYSRMLGESASPVALIALHDTTERRAMEEELERRSEALRAANQELTDSVGQLAASEVRHRALFAQAMDAVLLVDADTTVIRDANPQALQVIGATREELLDQTVAILDADGVVRFRNIVQETIRKTGVLFSEIPLRRRDGQFVSVDLSGSLVTYQDKRLVQLVFHDVSERRKLREQLEKTNRDLEVQGAELQRVNAQLARANVVKSQFLANMSHEIRTPLNAINGFAELLADDSFGTLDEQQRGFVERIIDAGQHLLQLINDVIDLSKVEAGTIKLDLQPIRVDLVVDQATKIIKGMARNKGVSLQVHMPDDPPVVLADERRIKQILFNLLTNAIRYAPEGTAVDISVESDADFARMSVTDRGAGIPPELHGAIFQEFVQVGRQEDQLGGAGLGLPLSRNLVELHGGEIGVESMPGAGATFWFSVPIAIPPEDETTIASVLHSIDAPGRLRPN